MLFRSPYSSRATSLNHESHSQYKEITLPELRDLVVLKRNDVGDATHTDGHYSFYVGKDKNYFFSSCDKAWRGTWKNVDILKPIEKKEMKEYLVKSQDGKWRLETDLAGDPADKVIELPEGAIKAYLNNSKTINFINADDDYMNNATNGEWIDTHRGRHEACGHVLVWQRQTHPEELPFIDDEPKIETATGYQLDVVGSNTYGSRSRYDGESDISYRQYLMNFIVGNRTESLNDQYAEIEKVRQSHRTASETSNPTIKETLNQRQSQYGSFEDVAMITEQMVDIMRKGYYENLAYNQKMALYMICSKMARIVNGDPNHKDSWHDIAGYATLIDNKLESEKDMPF